MAEGIRFVHKKNDMIIISIFTIIFIYCLFVVSREILKNHLEKNRKKIDGAEKSFKKFISQKDYLAREKKHLENEAVEIFTLYEITKDITNALSAEDAFEIFKTKLRDHVVFDKCLLLDSLSKEFKKLSKDDNYFIFMLKDKSRKIGALAIKDVNEKDHENIMILAHQFALALKRVHLYEEIEKIAITDSLTQVHTRRYFIERLEEELDRSKKYGIKMSFLMIDVDHFKNFNDEHGHLTGDQILREIGAIIKDSIREIDIAGRYGGEEFCVVLPDTDKEGALFAAERIRKAAEKATIKAYDAVVKTTVSIGLSTYPADGKATSSLIDKADWALYRAKKQGRNAVCSFGVYDE